MESVFEKKSLVAMGGGGIALYEVEALNWRYKHPVAVPPHIRFLKPYQEDVKQFYFLCRSLLKHFG